MPRSKERLAVYGYVRSNYKHSIPEVIIRLFAIYFTSIFSIVWKGKDLQNLLSLPNKEFRRYIVKFNNDLSFSLYISPNGPNPIHKGFMLIGIRIETMSRNIENIRMCYQHKLYQNMNSVVFVNCATA